MLRLKQELAGFESDSSSLQSTVVARQERVAELEAQLLQQRQTSLASQVAVQEAVHMKDIELHRLNEDHQAYVAEMEYKQGQLLKQLGIQGIRG